MQAHSIKNTQHLTRTSYIRQLRQEIDQQVTLDQISKLQFVAEIDEHIRQLTRSLSEADGCLINPEARAVELMQAPAELAESLRLADQAAKRSSPLTHLGVSIKTWLAFLQMRSTMVLAIAATCFAILSAKSFFAFMPMAFQEFWIIPAITLSVFGFTLWLSRFFENPDSKVTLYSQIAWLVFLAIGANFATMLAEYVESLNYAWATPGGYAAFVIAIGLFISVTFSHLYFTDSRLRRQFFQVSLLLITSSFAFLALLVSQVVIAGSGLLFCLFVATAVLISQSTRIYLTRLPPEQATQKGAP